MLIYGCRTDFRAKIIVTIIALFFLSMPKEMAHSKQATLPFLTGVNLAGADFGQKFPGERGTDYTYPAPKDVYRYQKMGFNIIRLPFRWERLQPDIFGKFNKTEWQHIESLLKAAEKSGSYLILDVHNYARRKLRKDGFKQDYLIGSKDLPLKAFTAFWQELAQRSASYPNVIFGMMNEPFHMPAKDWLGIAQATINAIRITGATQLILVPGTAWSGAHSWMSKEVNNVVMADIMDPGYNMAIEVHQYFDQDSSGSNPQAVSKTIGVERLQDFQNWARHHKIKAFLGEFGSGSDATSLAAISAMLAEISKNKDVWLGWTAWAAGPWWPDDDKFTLEQDSKGKMRKQTKLLMKIVKNK